MARPRLPTLTEAATAYLASRRHKALRSARDVGDQVQWWLARAGQTPLQALTRKVIGQHMRAKMAEEGGKSGATANRYASALLRVLKHAREDELIAALPDIPWQREAHKPGRALTREEADRLLAELPDYLRPIVAFALATGLRQANVTHLQWTAVDIGRRHLTVSADDAKAGKALGIPLSGPALAILEQQAGKNPLWVFPVEGKPYLYPAGRAFRSAVVRAGLAPFRFHDLRHTFATWHAQAGTPLDVLQKLCGWSTQKMLARYSHLSPGYVAQYADNVTAAQR